MSKEQTPITAGGFVRNKNMPKEYDIYLSKVGYDDSIDDLGYVKKCLDELVNAKVLEALEREIPKAYDAGWKCCLMGDKFEGWDIEHTMETRKKKYYETQVKPKYNPEN